MRDVLVEAEIVIGIESLAADELRRIPQIRPLQRDDIRTGAIRFRVTEDLRPLMKLNLCQAIYQVLRFEAPRPKALLGDQNFRRLTSAILTVMSLHPQGTFLTLGIDAAGSDSSVMIRLKNELSLAVGLKPVESERGDMLIRILPSEGGWDCLIRITPRPLATRAWRRRNYPAALNATVAHAMALLTKPSQQDVYVNLCAGSGGLLIERAAAQASAALIGIEKDESVIRLAAENMKTLSAQTHASLVVADAGYSPLVTGCASAIVADLPFGHRSGSHSENAALYPRILSEAARLARKDALCILLTHEIQLMTSTLRAQSHWKPENIYPIVLRGLHPRIYVLKRAL